MPTAHLTNKSLKETREELGNLEQSVKSLIKSAKELTQIVATQSKSMVQLKEKSEAVNKTNKKIDAIEKQRLQLLEKLKRANSDRIQKNVELQVQLQKQNKINKELARDKLKLIGAYERESKKLIELRKRHKDTAISQGLNSKETKRLAREVQALDSKLKKVDATGGQFGRVVGGYPKIFQGATKAIISAGAAFLSLRAAFSVVKNGLNTIKNFEKGMSEVRAITGAVGEAFKELQDNAIKLGSSTSKSAIQVAGLQKEFAKLGFSTKEIIAATEATIDLSIAADTDLANAAKVAASTIRGFNLSTAETRRVTDVMAKSFTTTGLDIEKFSVAMANAQVASKSTGVSLEQTAAMLGTIVDTGTDASKAGTDLRAILSRLSKQGLTLSDAYNKVNNSTNKVVTAMGLVGDRAFSSLITLSENKEKVDELTTSYKDASGAAAEMAKIMEDNLTGDISKASSAWEGFILGLNNGTGALSNASRAIVQFGTRAVQSLSILDLWFKKEERFTTKDFEKLLNAAGIVETESGKTIEEIINNFEKLNSKLDSVGFEENLEIIQKQFTDLFTEAGESATAIAGLWDVYLKRRREQYRIEVEAAKAAEEAKIKAAEEAEINRTKLAKEEAVKRGKAEEEAAKELEKKRQARSLRQAEEEAAAVNKKKLEEFEKYVEQIEAENEALTNSLIDDNENFIEEFEAQEARKIEIAKNRIKQLEEAERDLKSKQIQGINEVFNIASSLRARNLQELEIKQQEELALIEERKNREIASAEAQGISTKNITQKYEKQEADIKEKFAKQEREIQRKQAIQDKIQAAFAVGLDIAKGVIKYSSNPLTAPLVPAFLALGAVQLAAIAASPIPALEHGTENFEGGPAIVSDGKGSDKRELFITPDNMIGLTPKTQSIMDMPKGTIVKPNYSKETKEFIKNKENNNLTGDYLKSLLIEQRKTRSSLNKLTVQQQIIDSSGYKYIEQKNNQRSRHINKYWK